MKSEGFSYPSNVPNDLDRVIEDRRYGLWLETSARLYGRHDQPSDVDAMLSKLAASGGAPWSDAENKCVGQTVNSGTMTDVFATPEQDSDSLVSELQTLAYQSAAAAPEWKEARNDWWSCLEKSGLDPDKADGKWTSKQGEQAFRQSGDQPSAEEIRLSYIEANCNMEVRLSQRLGDLEASYQASLIQKNQAALNKEKDLKNRLSAAQLKYIAQFG